MVQTDTVRGRADGGEGGTKVRKEICSLTRVPALFLQDKGTVPFKDKLKTNIKHQEYFFFSFYAPFHCTPRNISVYNVSNALKHS